MAKITIEGKEHSCSKRVKEEIERLDIRIKTAKKLAQQIEEKQDELDAIVSTRETEIQELINQLKEIY